MSTEQAIKLAIEEFEDLKNRGCCVDWTVKIKNVDRIHKSFRNKTGRVWIYDPENNDKVLVNLDEGGAVYLSLDNFDIIGDNNGQAS
jgi:hypothetical protein